MDKVHKFLCSKPWRDLSYNLKIQAGGKCSRCSYQVIDTKDFKYLIGHHTIELTEDNVDDPNVSLNPDLIEIICHNCHNKEHRRFGNRQGVYIVYGPPLGGKNTMVRDMYVYGDIVVDVDALWQAITMEDLYIKPNNIRFNLFKLRDELFSQIKTRYGNWYNAYIIGGYPEKYERRRLADELGAEIIFCEATKEECIERARENNRPNKWIDYIELWFEKYNG